MNYFIIISLFRSQYSPNNKTAIKTNGFWESYQSPRTELCTICAFTRPPVLFFKGLCPTSSLDFLFYPENKGYQVIYSGYKTSKITLFNSTWTADGKPSSDQATSKLCLEDTKLEYPVGRNVWHLDNNQLIDCPDTTQNLNITISQCITGEEFTCGNGLCISMDKRCNSKDECFDKSDEENCYTFQTDYPYNKLNPPQHKLLKSGQKAAEIGIGIEIISVDKIDIDNSKIVLSYRLELSWVENRLSYFNLVQNNTEDYVTKELSTSFMSDLWDPLTLLHHKNGEVGSIFMEPSSKELKVKVKNDPKRVNAEKSFENLKYPGNIGVLYQQITMKGVYNCNYDLFRFPFDEQECSIVLELKTSHDIKMITNYKNNSVSFNGNRYLTEFYIIDSVPYSSKDDNRIKFGFVVRFNHLYQKQLINLYFQTVLLWTISYLTLYIKIDDFSNRFIGSVTTLLVLSSLMDSINERSPASHIKLIDIWNIWNVCQIVFVIMFHILVNRILEKQTTPVKHLQPGNINTMAKVGFPVLQITFLFYYISHILIYQENRDGCLV